MNFVPTSFTILL